MTHKEAIETLNILRIYMLGDDFEKRSLNAIDHASKMITRLNIFELCLKERCEAQIDLPWEVCREWIEHLKEGWPNASNSL